MSRKIQKPVKHRKRLSATVLKEIREKIVHISHREGASYSFVISVLLAKVLGVKNQQGYDD